jgi:hypothetical protein
MVTPGGPPTNGYNLFAVAHAIKASVLPPVQRHLLHVMALTPAQGSDGLCAGPAFSYPRLAEATGYSRRTVVRGLLGLSGAGWLDRIPGGTGRRNSYRIHVPLALVATAPGEAPETIHNPCPSDTGSPADPCTSDTGTRVTVTRDPCRSDTPSFPFLTEIPSIDQSVRGRVRLACPDLHPDDDDLALLITNLETRTPNPVRNVVAYLQTCPPADIRRLLAEAKTQVRDKPASAPAAPAEAPGECEHGHAAGTNPTTGTPRCPIARRAGAPACAAIPQAAVPLSRSVPFVASLDGRDRRPPLDAAESLSGPICAGAGA